MPRDLTPLVRRAAPVRGIFVALAVAAAFAACSGPGPSAPVSPTPGAPTAPPTAAPPTAGPPTSSPSGPAGVIVTIAAGGETFRVLLTEADDIATARELLAGTSMANIPNGRVVRGDPGVNTGYSWHLDPADFEWAEVTIELCDGKPSDVEKNAISGDRFCPWSAKVTAIEDAG
jgi:hypothetical protein